MPLIRSLLSITPILLLVFGGLACASSDDATEPTVTELEQDGFTPLFDGKTLDGWRKVGGDAEFKVQDGQIIGICDNTAKNTFLRTEDTYSDFEFRCEFKWDTESNSGVQFRSHQRENNAGEPVGRVFGYQYELDPSKRAWSGGLFEEGRRGWLYNLEGQEHKAKREAIKLDDWNELVIRCEDNHIQTWLNGVQVVDYIDQTDEALHEGFFALQVHSGKTGLMLWRNLRLKDLSGS